MPHIRVRGIYRVRFVPTDEVRYIGSSIDMIKRWSRHRQALNRNVYANLNPRWQNAWNKYGEAAFVFEVEEDHSYMGPEFCTNAYLIEREQFFINLYPDLYNYALAGRPPSRKGSVRGPDERRKVSTALNGHTVSTETRMRISSAQIGKTVPIERREKISASKKGRPQPPGFGAKVSAYLTGRKRSPETIAKVAYANSKCYEVTSPSGDVTSIRNLNAFCKENRLSASKMCLVAQGKRAHHKGWLCHKCAADAL